MGIEVLEVSADNISGEEQFWDVLNPPLNGTDARRRLEDKLEEKRLMKELQEFDFDFEFDV
jgi:hypothetical protein